MPWAMMVDSRATTGLPCCRAAATSGDKEMAGCTCGACFPGSAQTLLMSLSVAVLEQSLNAAALPPAVHSEMAECSHQALRVLKTCSRPAFGVKGAV